MTPAICCGTINLPFCASLLLQYRHAATVSAAGNQQSGRLGNTYLSALDDLQKPSIHSNRVLFQGTTRPESTQACGLQGRLQKWLAVRQPAKK